MKRILSFLLLIPLFVRADWDQFFSDDDPTLFHHVNVMTGNLNLSFQDGNIEGAKTLPLIRTYSSSGALERHKKENADIALRRARKGWMIQGGWNFLPHANLYIEPARKRENIKIFLAEKSGGVLTYTYSRRHKKDKHIFYFKPDQTISQCAGSLSARNNPQYNEIEFCTEDRKIILTLPDGGKRVYEGRHVSLGYERTENCFYRLCSETLPSKHKIEYTYDKDHKHIETVSITNPSGTKNYASMKLDYIHEDPPFHFRIETSDSKTIDFKAKKFKARDYLNEVISNYRPEENFGFEKSRYGIGQRMGSLSIGGKLQFSVEYYEAKNGKEEEEWLKNPHKKGILGDKVHSLKAPIGPEGNELSLATFIYKQTYTDVRDVDNLLTRYHHDSKNLTLVQHFNDQGHITSQMKFLWEGGRLKGKFMLDGDGGALFGKTFHYDGSGNVDEEIFWGNLTGSASSSFVLNGEGTLSGAETFSKKYKYLPKFNIPTSEEQDDGLTYLYDYHPDTDLLQAKFTCNKDKILIREFFFYNSDHLLEAEIIDDGNTKDLRDLSDVTERHIKCYDLDPVSGMVNGISELYWDKTSGNEILLSRHQYVYSARKQVKEDAVYDKDNIHRYTLLTDYDDHGHIKLKTNPLGQANTYLYDDLGHLKEVKEVGQLKKIYSYDKAGKPDTCEEIDSMGNKKITKSEYDAKGRLLSQTDARGNKTTQTYDCFGRCNETHFPQVKDDKGEIYTPTVHFTYDAIGNLASTTTPKGEITKTFYNTLRKPIHSIQSDGYEVTHRYHKSGTLAQTTYPDQTRIEYTYDIFQRMTSKIVYSSANEKLSEEKWDYNAFHLLVHTDPHGLITTYEYDGAGRKIADQAEDRKTTYAYDALGFLERTTIGDTSHIQLHDVGGRVFEEWHEDSLGQKEKHMRFSYNDDNRKCKAIRVTSQGDAVDNFHYDDDGRLMIHTGPCQYQMQYFYDDVSNDLGQKVFQKTTIDALGNSTTEIYDALGHLVVCKKKDSEWKTVAREEYSYDRSGNKTKRTTTSYLLDAPQKTISTSWEYDTCGRPIKEIDPEKKVTTYTYDTRGRLKTRTLPSGITLSYVYDGIDRIKELFSSDDTVHYQYHYDLGPKPTEIHDLINRTHIERSYNSFGELEKETYPSHTLLWSYDNQGRCTEFILPDRSFIEYSFQGSHLTSVKRHSPSGNIQYEHNYTEFDPNGHVQEETLIHNLSKLTTTRDLLERPSAQICNAFSHSIAYGPSSLVIKTNNSLYGEKNYTYDGLNQLRSEGNKEHLFDSLGNPTNCQTNDCNQILATQDSTLTYDLDGNPKERITPNTTTIYSYDALGRLTSLTTPEKTVQYTYDGLSRLIAKETDTQKHLFLYDQDKEIGTLTEHGDILELKVLGLGIQGDIGAAIAIELFGNVYAPLHDFNGHVIALLDSTGNIFESYQIDAFGKETSSHPPINPWRFCSKRSDEGLVFFGKRFYDPSLGRWLTPDPAGFADGPNLYVYVLNSPLNRLDLFGLSSQDLFPNKIRIEAPTHIFFHAPSASGVFVCKGFINDVEVDCVIACKFWHKLQFTPEELALGKINVVDHLTELVPKEGTTVGLISIQNGIMTSLDEFTQIANQIFNKVEEGTLLVGLYNSSKNLLSDLNRVRKEFNGKETTIVSLSRQFIGGFAEKLDKINPNLLMLQLMHSEGGLIGYRAIEGMNEKQRDLIKKHLYLFALGPARAIPLNFGFYAYNVYSNQDHVTKHFTKSYRNDPNYDIAFVRCTTHWTDKVGFFADHGIMEKTYNGQTDKFFQDIRREYRFYDGSTH